MTGLRPRRRLWLCFIAVSILPIFYILYVNLEVRLPWYMVSNFQASHLQDARSHNYEHRDDGSTDQWTTKVLLVNDSKASASTEDQHMYTTPTPFLRLPYIPTEVKRIAQSESGDSRKPTPKSTAGIIKDSSNPLKTTEPPFIGDIYYMEDNPPQTDCPDSIRKRVADTVFGKKFLERVPVLQWAKHVTRPEYERLSQYPGAHGWGGIAFDTLVATLSVLNKSANHHMLDDWERRFNGSLCVRCAVVGNGGILRDSGKGREIDQHDYVFRTNGAVIKGFEENVGSRTSLYTFSTNTLRNSMRSYSSLGYKGPPVSEETRYVFLPDHDRDYILMRAAATHVPILTGPERSKTPPKYFGENVTAEKFKMYHPDFVRYLRNRFLRSVNLKTKYKDMYRPSTGAVMLLAALHTCDQVSAYGFMTPDYQKYSDHYYDKSYHPVGFFINHDLRLEMALWQQLHHAGLIRLYMRP